MRSGEVVIVDLVRSPIGRRGGALSVVRADELLAQVLSALLRRTAVEPALVDDVIVGCVNQIGEQGGNIARAAALIAGLPYTVPAVTLDRRCASGESAMHFGCAAILAGDADLVIAAGVECMSRVPLGSARMGAEPSPLLDPQYRPVRQGVAAERIAARWRLTRQDLDTFALRSHRLAVAAVQAGRFDAELVPVAAKTDHSVRLVTLDENPRPDTNLEKLAALPPAFVTNGLVTAGTSAPIADGAAAVLLARRTRAKELGLKPKAEVLVRTVVGSDPELALTGPISATGRALERAGFHLRDVAVIEINEAFASVVLAWGKEWQPDWERVNPNGGALALGHPTGCSGVRLMCTLVHELERRGGGIGLQTMCVGGGQGTATVVVCHG